MPWHGISIKGLAKVHCVPSNRNAARCQCLGYRKKGVLFVGGMVRSNHVWHIAFINSTGNTGMPRFFRVNAANLGELVVGGEAVVLDAGPAG